MFLPTTVLMKVHNFLHSQKACLYLRLSTISTFKSIFLSSFTKFSRVLSSKICYTFLNRYPELYFNCPPVLFIFVISASINIKLCISPIL